MLTTVNMKPPTHVATQALIMNFATGVGTLIRDAAPAALNTPSTMKGTTARVTPIATTHTAKSVAVGALKSNKIGPGCVGRITTGINESEQQDQDAGHFVATGAGVGV